MFKGKFLSMLVQNGLDPKYIFFKINVPERIKDSFYRGNVHIGFKDAAFEPSSALRHSCELKEILQQKEGK